jgi:hypothetical protein
MPICKNQLQSRSAHQYEISHHWTISNHINPNLPLSAAGGTGAVTPQTLTGDLTFLTICPD